jgi:hypothetical protein
MPTGPTEAASAGLLTVAATEVRPPDAAAAAPEALRKARRFTGRTPSGTADRGCRTSSRAITALIFYREAAGSCMRAGERVSALLAEEWPAPRVCPEPIPSSVTAPSQRTLITE